MDDYSHGIDLLLSIAAVVFVLLWISAAVALIAWDGTKPSERRRGTDALIAALVAVGFLIASGVARFISSGEAGTAAAGTYLIAALVLSMAAMLAVIAAARAGESRTRPWTTMALLAVSALTVAPLWGVLLMFAFWLSSLLYVATRAKPSRDAPATLARKALLVALVSVGALFAVVIPRLLEPATGISFEALQLLTIAIPLAHVVLAATALIMAMVAADRGEQRTRLVRTVLLVAAPWLAILAVVLVMICIDYYCY